MAYNDRGGRAGKRLFDANDFGSHDGTDRRPQKSIPPRPKKFGPMRSSDEDDDIVYAVILHGHELNQEISRTYGKQHTQYVLDGVRLKEGEAVYAKPLYKMSETDYMRREPGSTAKLSEPDYENDKWAEYKK